MEPKILIYKFQDNIFPTSIPLITQAAIQHSLSFVKQILRFGQTSAVVSTCPIIMVLTGAGALLSDMCE